MPGMATLSPPGQVLLSRAPVARAWLTLAAAVSSLVLTGTAAGAATHWKIGVDRTGLYRVTGADLAQAGMPLAQVSPKTLRLSCGGRPVALHVTGDGDGRFDTTDAILFYGEALDTRYTGTNVYWLAYGGRPGRRMAVRPAAPPGAVRTAVRALPATIHLEENHRYGKLGFVRNPASAPRWFWELARPGDRREVRCVLQHLVAGSSGRLTVSLFGNTFSQAADPDHHVRLLVNSRLVADVRWDGQTERRIHASLPGGCLRNGVNTLAVECPGDTGAGEVDQVFLDWVKITYRRHLVMTGAPLEIHTPNGAAPGAVYAIQGVPPRTAFLDVTLPSAPVRLEGMALRQGEAWLAPGPSRRILACSEPDNPLWVKRDEASRLREREPGADYLVVAADDLVPALEPLLEWRRKQGMRVLVAPISEVYDEFSDGVFTPAAIRTLVRYACQHWRPPAPAFLLLVGDANFDYRDYLKTGVPNLVPTFLAPVPGGLETATDSFFACVDERDHLPHLAVGRLPVRTPAETATVVAKILRYEQSQPDPRLARALWVADHEGPTATVGVYERSFQSAVALCRQAGVDAELLALRSAGEGVPEAEQGRRVRQTCTPKVLEFLRAGGLLLGFHGHGNERYWSRQKVLTVDDLAQAGASPLPPLCVEISCFTGWFDKPDIPGSHSLAERLLLMPDGGAIACISPTRLGGLDLTERLVGHLLAHPEAPVGVALQDARRTFLTSRDWRFWDPVETYNLLGDPALRLRWPPSACLEEGATPQRGPAGS